LALGCGALVAFAAIPSSVRADFVGMDTNADLDCDPLITGDADMGRVYAGGDVGVQQDFAIFFDDIPVNMVGYGCTFCVTDSTHLDVGTVAFTYADGAWTNTNLFREGQTEFTVTVSQYIIDNYPKHLCFLISGVDFSFVGVPLPHAVGTCTFEPASEGSIAWVFDVGDALTTGVQDINFSTYAFDLPGESCPPPAANEPGKSWGAVKSLFR